LFEFVEAAFGDVAALVALPLVIAEVDGPAGTFAPMGDLAATFGDGGGDPVFTGQARFAREGWPLSASSRSGRVRGRPPAPAARIWLGVAVSMLASAAWPGVGMGADARPFPSQTRWFFVVSPPRGRPIA
jgi:hypothetical protein